MVENQIRHRDLTMVEQAQCVAGYRITMGGRLSTGMYSELMYASHTAEPARPVLMYAAPPPSSFPITAVRDDADLRATIDDIRSELHRRFIVFDPLTLDEGTPQVLAKAQDAVAHNVSEITICDDEARWPLTLTGTLSEGRPPTYPMTLDPQEALEVWDDLENQIRHRDLTMVEQAQCVAGYRITMGGRLSTGMYSELMYASHTAEPARPVLMYADASDHGLEHPFLRNFNHRTFYSIEDWFDAISRIGPSASPEAQQALF